MKRRLVLVALIAAVVLALVPSPIAAAPALSQQRSSAACSWYYTVRWGDTLADIAWRYGVSMWSIASVNGISNLNRIYAGQSLLIPCAAPARPCYHYVIANVDRIYAGQWLVIPGCWW